MNSGYHPYIGCNHLTKRHHIFQGEKPSLLYAFDFSHKALKLYIYKKNQIIRRSNSSESIKSGKYFPLYLLYT